MKTCTCLHSILHSTACKHTHLIHKYCNLTSSPSTATEAQENIQQTRTLLTISSAQPGAVEVQKHIQSTTTLLIGTVQVMYTVGNSSFFPVRANNTPLSQSALKTCTDKMEIFPTINNATIVRSAHKKLKSLSLC